MNISLDGIASPGAKIAYIPSTDYVVRYLDGEKLGRADMERFIRHRLERIYPGDPDSVVFDYEALDGVVAVIVAAKSDRADFVARYPKADAVALVKGFRRLSGDFRRIALGPGWFEKADMIAGRWCSIERRIREAGASIPSEWGEGALPIQVLCDDGDVDAMKRQLLGANVEAFEAALVGKASRLFVAAPSFIVAHALSLSVLAALVLVNLSLAILANTAKGATEDYRNVLRQAGELTARASALDEELATLERGKHEDGSNDLAPGRILSALSLAGHGFSLQTFSFSEGGFVVRGSVPDAILYTETLRSIPGLENARLGDVRTSEDGKEVFTISGSKK